MWKGNCNMRKHPRGKMSSAACHDINMAGSVQKSTNRGETLSLNFPINKRVWNMSSNVTQGSNDVHEIFSLQLNFPYCAPM